MLFKTTRDMEALYLAAREKTENYIQLFFDDPGINNGFKTTMKSLSIYEI